MNGLHFTGEKPESPKNRWIYFDLSPGLLILDPMLFLIHLEVFFLFFFF